MISVSVVDAFVTDTQSLATSQTLKIPTNCSAGVSTTLAVLSAKDAVPDTSRKLGDNPKTTNLSLANVIKIRK